MKNIGMPFFGRGAFGTERMGDFREKWNKMSSEQKVAFIDEREKQFSEMFDADGKPNPEAWVKKLDARAEEWLSKSAEQKLAAIREHSEQHAQMHDCRGGFGQRGGFPGGGFPGWGGFPAGDKNQEQ